MKIMSIIGARPQFVKEAVINSEFSSRGVTEVLVNSGQHYDINMSDIFLDSLKIKTPDYNLNVGSGTHGEMTARILIEFEKILLKEKPDKVIVYGDTNTTLAGALAASKLSIPIAHVEAGIRMKPRTMPEEINRVLVDRIADFKFCPSSIALDNLSRESLSKGSYFTGDVMFDLFKKLESSFDLSMIDKLGLSSENYILCTMHRDYNVDHPDKLRGILSALSEISREKTVVFPMHPRTSRRIEQFNLKDQTGDIMIIEPLGYMQLMGLLSGASLLITDSGGLQKESYFAGKQALVLMPDTGWSELVDSGWNILCDENNIREHLTRLSKPESLSTIYGDGSAGSKIADILLSSKGGI